MKLEVRDVPSALQEGARLYSVGSIEQAEKLARQVVKISPNNFDALHLLGVCALAGKKYLLAVRMLTEALVRNAHSPYALSNRGIAKLELGRAAEALEDFDRAVALAPSFAEAHLNRANALMSLFRAKEALPAYETAISLNPRLAQALSGRGNALYELRRFNEAVASCRRAIEADPVMADAHANLANALRAVRRYQEALGSCDTALSLKPDHGVALANKALALCDLGRDKEAIQFFDRAIAINPRNVDAIHNRAIAKQLLRDLPGAMADYERALELHPGQMCLRGVVLNLNLNRAEWSTFKEQQAQMLHDIAKGILSVGPFDLLGLTEDPALIFQGVSMFQERLVRSDVGVRGPTARAQRNKLRIGYVSGDFRNHPMAHLLSEVFERHDRSRIETFGISIGPKDDSHIGRRMRDSVDTFIDAQFWSDDQLSAKVHALDLDILVDLLGYTSHARQSLFASKPAPVQVNWLGYPGTMAAPWIDYIIADAIVIPEGHEQFYSEKVVRMPHTYQSNNSTPLIGPPKTRAEVGLPPDAFVYCCFNNNWKINPPVFDRWAAILREVPDSVLWLLGNTPEFEANIRREARERGVAPERIIFAPRTDHPDHMARQIHADLFLDTRPYNAHTTASEALRMGVPLLTILGDAFASRVAASILNALGMPDLVVQTEAQYHDLAVALGRDRARSAALKARVAERVATAPLFDSETFARDLERAYAEMMRRFEHGLEPDAFAVAELVQ
jgi:predicted O-linked N-acetylglucosamine transferase (SPINDLY family)